MADCLGRLRLARSCHCLLPLPQHWAKRRQSWPKGVTPPYTSAVLEALFLLDFRFITATLVIYFPFSRSIYISCRIMEIEQVLHGSLNMNNYLRKQIKCSSCHNLYLHHLGKLFGKQIQGWNSFWSREILLLECHFNEFSNYHPNLFCLKLFSSIDYTIVTDEKLLIYIFVQVQILAAKIDT